jgi:hypothetical protein
MAITDDKLEIISELSQQIGMENLESIVRRLAPMVKTTLVRTSRGYRWEIQVRSDVPDEALAILDRVESELKQRYGEVAILSMELKQKYGGTTQ